MHLVSPYRAGKFYVVFAAVLQHMAALQGIRGVGWFWTDSGAECEGIQSLAGSIASGGRAGFKHRNY